jgi:pimeloyl-ACP methyl ester carboxylesterase
VPLRVGEVASSTHGWRLHVIEAAGHVPHIEQPDAFLAALRPAVESSIEKEAAA